MKPYQRPRLVIAAVHSGSGKTTVTAGILAAMKERGLVAQAYKIGPDYIDPGFHQIASGRSAHNLDSWLTPDEALLSIFAETSATADICVIEGVMGLYDGGRGGISSTATIAKLLRAPVILIIDAKSMADSAAAIALGFKMYDPDVQLAGVIINRLASDSHREMVTKAIEALDIEVLGAISRDVALTMPERHLGLTPVTEEISSRATLEKIKTRILQQVNIDRLINIAGLAPNLVSPAKKTQQESVQKVRVGVASDAAFSFYYPESLSVLERLGAEIVPFSPLEDQNLPVVGGLMIGGGFPEMFAAQLSENTSMRKAIFMAGKQGMPIYAECGGLMYLTKELAAFDHKIYPMAGLIPAVCHMHEKLQTVGYVSAKALRPSILCNGSDQIRGHEFHFSSMELAVDDETQFPWAFEMTKMRTGKKSFAGYTSGSILASYLHIHFAGNEDCAKHFINYCRDFSQNQSGGDEIGK